MWAGPDSLGNLQGRPPCLLGLLVLPAAPASPGLPPHGPVSALIGMWPYSLGGSVSSSLLQGHQSGVQGPTCFRMTSS